MDKALVQELADRFTRNYDGKPAADKPLICKDDIRATAKLFPNRDRLRYDPEA